MIHSMLTVAIPFDNALASDVETYLDGLGNPVRPATQARIDEAEFMHFMSINVIRGDDGASAFIVMEISADGGQPSVLQRTAEMLAAELTGLFESARISLHDASMSAFLARHQHDVGQGWFSTPGLNFDGSPQMAVPRIKKEAQLAKLIGTMLDSAPTFRSALDTLNWVRSKLWTDEAMKWAFVGEPAPCLEGKPDTAAALPQVLLSAVQAFLWPFLLLAAIVFALIWWFASAKAAVWLTLLVLAAEAVLAVAAYLALRQKENTDVSGVPLPAPGITAEIMAHESYTAHNHLAAMSVMKPGRLRHFTLRLGLWAAAQIAAHGSRPSFLGDTGVIHFARWILLPGTNKLLFFSNFDAPWESYIQDFIQIAPNGVTGIWSNTVGFPRTENLFGKGAVDGDRLIPWTRCQQYPSRFWYTAYSDITLDRVRTNAAIHQGIALASTEAEAQDWLSCFGSAPRPDPSIVYAEVPTLVLGGLRRLRFGQCLVLKLPAAAGANKEWLRQVEPYIGYGDTLLARSVVAVGFSASGLRKLGLNESQVVTFPVSFQQGSDASWRARAMGDTGASAPENWVWGTKTHTADAVMLVYAVDEQILSELVATRIAEFAKAGIDVTYQIEFEPVPERPLPVVEPFGFVDGVSDPIIRGIGHWTADQNSIHLVEAGEFVLGYPDNSGYMPASPFVAAADDPDHILRAVVPDPAREPTAFPPQRPNFELPRPAGQHDLGFNGSFLVVRQLEQDADAFKTYVNDTAAQIASDPRLPAKELVPADDWKTPIQDWIAAKLVGRWHDGTSLVRHPHRPGSVRAGQQVAVQPDNDFLFGAEDPTGLRCPFGAHVRRANPRDNLIPNLPLKQNQSAILNLLTPAPPQLSITNRHRIMRVGRPYRPQNGLAKPGLVFMCLNVDIERQFEFLQQIWILNPSMQALENETDALLGHGGASGMFTIPTPKGPLRLKGLKDFVTVRGSGYFFLPGQRALRFLAQ
jgi:deferrochelatase/peroxidase EfeB